MQQINLYQAVLHKKKSRFTPTAFRQYAILAAAVLIVISAIQGWQYYSASEDISALKQTQQQLLLDVQTFSNELSAISDDSVLKSSIRLKELELGNKQNVLQVLSGKQFGNAKGFAEHFVGLARQHVDGVWLTGLHIHSGGTLLNLSGHAYMAENVPKYLQNLSQETEFRGLEFKTFLLERKDKSSSVSFNIRSQAEDAVK